MRKSFSRFKLIIWILILPLLPLLINMKKIKIRIKIKINLFLSRRPERTGRKRIK